MKFFYLLIYLLSISSAPTSASYKAVLFINNIFNGTNIPHEFEDRIKSVCDGFQAANGEKWESVMEEDNIKIVFQCTDAPMDEAANGEDRSWIMKLLSTYIRSFERNRPQKWHQKEQPNDFACKDSYGRDIPMPLGVQRCFVQHHSTVNTEDKAINYTIHQESGTFSKPIHQLSVYSCGDSFTWKPYSSSSLPSSSPSTPPSTEPPTDTSTNTSPKRSTMYLNDQECAVKVSLTAMHFFCCCYSNGNLCGAIGNVTGQGLTCPQISMNATLTVDENTWEYNETENVEARISADKLILQEQCHMRIAVNRPKREAKLETSISLVKEDDDICKLMYETRLNGKNCHSLERQCYTDVDPVLIYCCRFKYSKERVGSDGKILSIHSVFADFVLAELKNHLRRFQKCLRPYSDEDKPYCIYFYDKIMDRFVNIQMGPKNINFKLSGHVRQRISAFLANDSARFIYIEGELNTNDKRVTGCSEESKNLKRIPFWYRLTVAMFKCFTPFVDEHGNERCDDFVQNQTIIQEIRSTVEDQYICNVKESTDLVVRTATSWDMYCLEIVTSNVTNTDDYSVTMENEARGISSSVRQKDWRSDSGKNDDVQKIGIKWCSYTTKDDIGTRVCACSSHLTSKFDKKSEKPCNDGDFVKNMHLIESCPEVDFEDKPSQCVIPYVSEYDDRHVCVKQTEKNTTQSCVIGIKNGEHPDIGCIREPNLSHLKLDHRMQTFDWTVYQICNEIFKPEEKDFLCVLRDSDTMPHTMPYTQYEIICCCRTDTCAAAYKYASNARKTLDAFY